MSRIVNLTCSDCGKKLKFKKEFNAPAPHPDVPYVCGPCTGKRIFGNRRKKGKTK